ncbi:MAG: protein Xni [Psychrobacter glaciei]|jgi:protein Xni
MEIDLLLIDAMNLIRRIYAAQQQRAEDPVEATLLHSQNAVLKNIENTNAKHVALVFDGKGPTWRHDLYSEYKADRKPMPEELDIALPSFIKRFEALGIPCLLYNQYEADDVIATLAVKTSKLGGTVSIVSTDKGFMQISDKNTHLYHHFDKRLLSFDDVNMQLGLKPVQLIDFLSLVGDTTNHVPGIPGIGPKTAGTLLDQYGDLDTVLINSEDVKGKVGESLREHYRVALFARILVTLKLDCKLGLNLKKLRYIKPR